MRADLRFAAYGLALGYLLSWMGFTSYDEVNAMFALTDPRLWLAFGVAVVITGVGFRLRRGAAPSKPMHAGIVPGAVLFGLGWAICGACPGAAFAQLGEGQLGAAVSIVGIFIGAWLYTRTPTRR